jgi:hypothetical protein
VIAIERPGLEMKKVPMSRYARKNIPAQAAATMIILQGRKSLST